MFHELFHELFHSCSVSCSMYSLTPVPLTSVRRPRCPTALRPRGATPARFPHLPALAGSCLFSTDFLLQSDISGPGRLPGQISLLLYHSCPMVVPCLSHGPPATMWDTLGKRVGEAVGCRALCLALCCGGVPVPLAAHLVASHIVGTPAPTPGAPGHRNSCHKVGGSCAPGARHRKGCQKNVR